MIKTQMLSLSALSHTSQRAKYLHTVQSENSTGMETRHKEQRICVLVFLNLNLVSKRLLLNAARLLVTKS